jgi:hypothetical protein
MTDTPRALIVCGNRTVPSFVPTLCIRIVASPGSSPTKSLKTRNNE